MNINNHFLIDTAIKAEDEDIFNFKHYAEKVKVLIQNNSSNSESFTIGIYGKWGEGKTSFLNLIKSKIEHFDKDKGEKEFLVYDFNPWRYSTEDEMVYDFFDGLCKKFFIQKNKTVQKIGKLIEDYSEYLSSIKFTIGTPVKKIEILPDKFLKAFGNHLKGKEITIEKLKDKVNQEIKKVNFKIIVVIDDLDRLDKNEIYAILKLIKLNANFDNFIFITTLDSEQVAKAIKDRYGNDIQDGYTFLEKIITIPIHLPRIEEEDLKLFFEKKFENILDKLSFLTYENKTQLIRDITSDISLGIFNSPREIIRILNSFFTTAFTIGEEINLEDLFWLEYIKIKDENCYNSLKTYQQNIYLRVINSIIDFKEPFIENEYKKRDEIFKNFKNMKPILQKLFPKGENKIDPISINKNLKINSSEHFDKYFSYHTERKISNKEFKKIESLIKERKSNELSEILKNLFTNADIYRSINKIENLFELIEDNEERNFFFKNIFKNLVHLPNTEEGYLDQKTRLVEKIAKILNADYNKKGIENDNSKISIELAEILELNELCYFVRKFYEKHSFKKDISEILVRKAKSYISGNPKFYVNPHNLPNKSIFYYLNKIDKDYLNNFLLNNIEDIKELKLIIRNFAPYWNNSFFGGIDNESFDYIKNVLDINILMDKIKLFDLSLIDEVKKKSEINIDKLDETTLEQNLNQFIYWCLKEDPNTEH